MQLPNTIAETVGDTNITLAAATMEVVEAEVAEANSLTTPGRVDLMEWIAAMSTDGSPTRHVRKWATRGGHISKPNALMLGTRKQQRSKPQPAPIHLMTTRSLLTKS